MFDVTRMNYSMSIAESNKPSADNLYVEFFEILQTHTQSDELLKAIAEMSRSCADALTVIRAANAKLISKPVNDIWLENERNTWRLLYILYSDRLVTRSSSNEEDISDSDMSSYFGHSEKYCMLSLFKRNNLIRECQLVVDWLECNAAQKDDGILHFSDCSMGWENTLHQLKSKDTIVFEATHNIVNNMDPDSQYYQKLPLHDIDMEDEKKLCYKVFHQVRCGKLDDAQKLCAQSGHYWRSALLEGWKLYHNPNLDDQFSREYDEGFAEESPMDDESDDKPVEGNENRDLWKVTAWNYSNNPSLDTYEKAAVAAFCGNLKSLINVCKTWEDYLWAHMKVMIDIKVESEVRENVTKNYKDMPNTYWEQRMSINEIFAALEASKTKTVQRESLLLDHIIQKFIILEEYNNLLDAIADWILDPNISTQFLRFVSHLLLFLEQIDQVNNREITEKVIEEYLKRLIHDKQTQLVAFYVSKLTETTQIHIYSTYLESIVDNEARKEALQYAEDCGLNVAAITKQIVENIRGRHDSPIEMENMSVTKSDEFKINSLDWLLFYNKQLAELVHQTNALVFQFLLMQKHDAAQLAFNKVPDDAVGKLSAGDDIPEELQQIVREYLSYKAYFEAQEAFSVWFKNFKSQPKEPECPPEGAPFAKKVEYEHKLSQFSAETGRWKITMEQLSKQAKLPLYNVLLFPDGGWLHGAKEASYLQNKYIPQCLLLLFNVLYDSEQFEECVQLADILASEKYQVYKYFSHEKMAEALRKIAEASVALLNHGKDPWGNDTRA
ncbi:nuclear pore complex protein Nup107 isoform X2 [Atheta coriaria]